MFEVEDFMLKVAQREVDEERAYENTVDAITEKLTESNYREMYDRIQYLNSSNQFNYWFA